MDRLDKIIKSGYLQIKKDRSKQDRDKCLDDEAMALYVQGMLRRSKREKVIGHLLMCEDCLQDIIYLKGLSGEMGRLETYPYLETPEELVKEAMALIPEENKPDIFKVIVKLAKDSIRLIKTYGDMVNILSPLPEPVRGEERERWEEIIPITKTFKECQVRVEIERLPNQSSCRINLKVMEKIGNSPLGDIRVSLFDSDRELESYYPEKGEVIFDTLSPKDYRIEISRRWDKIGEAEIKIMSNAGGKPWKSKKLRKKRILKGFSGN